MDEQIDRDLEDVEREGSERERRLADMIRALRAALADTVSDNGPPEE